MSPLAVIGIVAIIAALYVSWTSRNVRADVAAADDLFARFGPSEGLSAGIGRLAAPAIRTRTVAELSSSPMTRKLKETVIASGLYGGNVDVFISYQVAAVVIGCMLEAFALLDGIPGFARLAFVLAGVAIAGWPYNQVSTTAKKMAAEADAQLPDFVELLQIGIAASMSIQPALTFTLSQFPSGPVSNQVRWLLDTLESGSMGEAEAYAEAGRRIGSTDAAAFFSALGQASVSGAKVTASLERQAASMRLKAHQARRAKIKRIPVTLVVAFAVHFLPLLFVITMLPLMLGLGGL